MIRHVQTRRWGVPCALAVMLLIAGFGTPFADEPELVKETFQWFDPVRPGETARVSNPHGSIFARFGGYGEQLEILATRQRIEAGREALEVERRRVEGGLDVVVVDPEQDPDGRRDRIDLVVFVPKGVALEASTDDGSMEIKKLKSDLTASSVTGDIYIRGIGGRVNAKSARGSLEVTLSSGATDETQRLSTQTGDIMVHVWEDAAVDARLSTSGEISTDFSLTIEHRRLEEPSKHAVATINGGGPRLEMTSKRGRLRLLRLQKDYRPNDPSEAGDQGKRAP